MKLESSFPLKLDEEDEVGNQALEPKLGLVGSFTRQGEHGQAVLAWRGGQTKQGNRGRKRGIFAREEGGVLALAWRGWGALMMAQGSPMASARNPLKLGQGDRVFVCVCV